MKLGTHWGCLALLALSQLVACSRRDPDLFQGYVEGEYLYLGAPVAGTLAERPVNRGDSVRAGDVLFVLESAAEHAEVAEAERHLAETQAKVDNLLKGRRPTELAAMEARQAQAQASLDLWVSELTRREKLFRDRVISSAELDQVRSQRDGAQAARDLAAAELATARLGGRDDEIRAAQAEQEAAAATVTRAKWDIDQKTQRSPATGVVHDTLFRTGEFVPAGAPVIALLPPANIKARFFVPEARLTSLAPGAGVVLHRDGTNSTVTGRVTYIATQPEFTPPIIYSRETRAKLVYMVEATVAPEVAAQLRPGQPIDVQLASP